MHYIEQISLYPQMLGKESKNMESIREWNEGR